MFGLHCIDCDYFRIWPAVLRQATYGTIKFGTYYSLKKVFAKRRADGGTKEHLLTNTACAAFAGGLSSAIANPTDVLKVRMQVISSYLSLFSREMFICILNYLIELITLVRLL